MPATGRPGILTPGYDGYCRHRGLARGDGRALRFRTPGRRRHRRCTT